MPMGAKPVPLKHWSQADRAHRTRVSLELVHWSFSRKKVEICLFCREMLKCGIFVWKSWAEIFFFIFMSWCTTLFILFMPDPEEDLPAEVVLPMVMFEVRALCPQILHVNLSQKRIGGVA